MALSPPPWQLALARIEGALPFLSAGVADGLALASLRRLWRVHVRDFPQENQGPEHNPGLEAAELPRSWYTAARRDFLSWTSRRAPVPQSVVEGKNGARRGDHGVTRVLKKQDIHHKSQ